MSSYNGRMADLLLADQARWQARQDAENAPTDTSRAAMDSYECETPLLRGIGMVGTSGANRRYPRPAPRTRAHGAATLPPTPEAAERLASGDVEATVLCYNVNDPENVTVRTVASFRASGDSAKNRAPVVAAPRTVVDTARFDHGHDFND